MSFIEIEQQARGLSVSERAALVASLLETFPGERAVVTDEEAAHRDAELDSGAVQAVLHDDFVLRARMERGQ